MTDSDLQFTDCGRLLIGFRCDQEEQARVISRCRRFDGTMLLREGEVMVFEIAGYPAEIDDLLSMLPREGITHLWRSGRMVPGPEPGACPKPNFCGINE
jgi:acetolactate synthase small subunit